MPNDPTEQLAELRDELDRRGQRFENAGRSISRVTGEDSTGAVTVSVEGSGVVRQVALAADWQRRLDPSVLGAAVQQAVLAAAARRAEQWATSYAEDEQVLPVRPMPTPGQSLAGQLSEVARTAEASGSDEQVLEALLDMLRSLNDSIDDVSAQVRAQLNSEVEGRSSSGRVAATVTGSGSVVGVRLDEQWAGRAHHNNVARELTEAFDDAYRKAAANGATPTVERSAIGELARLGRDPVALAERLRLLG